ncbi:MAG: lasso peptide biosynthesis B2 protein [Sphingomonas sp.]|jgi:hypothetical protein|uniref:lasso peptide biosynthesis B2 protein n=1 Tax=Sphingomonas sp. TaxID=28214 RepID=UPI003567DE9D
MFWQILPHTSACIAADRIILLDVRQDRYLLVPPAITGPVAAWLSSSVARAAPSDLVAMLERSAIWKPGDPAPSHQRCDLAIPMTLETPERRRPIGLVQHARIDGIIAATWLGLRTTPLRVQLDRQMARNARSSTPDSDQLSERLSSFQQARRLNPIARNCLLDSLALARWLSAGRYACRIVFGVAATPFAAHCWLQDEHAILNDHYDRVSKFTPIYAT